MKLVFDTTLLAAGIVIGVFGPSVVGSVPFWTPSPDDRVSLSLGLFFLAAVCLLVSILARTVLFALAPRPLRLRQFSGSNGRPAHSIVSWYDQVVRKPKAGPGLKPEYGQVAEACAETLFDQVSSSCATPDLARAIQIAVCVSRIDSASRRRGIDELARDAARALKKGQPFCPQAFVQRWERLRPELARHLETDISHAFPPTRVLAEIAKTRASGRIVASGTQSAGSIVQRPLWKVLGLSPIIWRRRKRRTLLRSSMSIGRSIWSLIA
jgi:hypothetical protein